MLLWILYRYLAYTAFHLWCSTCSISQLGNAIENKLINFENLSWKEASIVTKLHFFLIKKNKFIKASAFNARLSRLSSWKILFNIKIRIQLHKLFHFNVLGRRTVANGLTFGWKSTWSWRGVVDWTAYNQLWCKHWNLYLLWNHVITMC